MNKLKALEQAWVLASTHVEEKIDQQVGVGPRLESLLSMDLDLTTKARDEEQLFADMRMYLEHTPNTLSPYFQNQLFSGINPYALAADWLTSVTNSTMATYEVAPVATVIERTLINHMISKCGWGQGDGIMVTGGSNANLVAMLLARNTLYPETKKSGVLPLKLTVFVSEEAHYSFEKAANIMGLGTEQVIKVPSDDDGKMDLKALELLIQLSLSEGATPFFIAGTAGTTVLGAFDPLEAMAIIAEKYQLWLHVDGAWGGSVLLSQKHRSLMKGIKHADSLAWDTHKMMGTGLVSSFFLTQHPQSLRHSHQGGGADYIFHESEASSWDLGPSSLQCGRRNDAFKVWLAWRSLGDEGFEQLIDTLFEKAQLAQELVMNNPELELLQTPSMLNICFRYRCALPSEMAKKIRTQLLAEGRFYVNVATRRGETFFRMITVNPHLTRGHVDELLQSIVRIGKQLARSL